MSITLDLLPEPDSRTAEQGTYDTNKARFTGRSCVAGNVAVEMLPTLPVYPSLARSRNALLSGAARNAASGRGRIMSGSARARNAVLVRCARAGMWPAARAPYVPRRGQRQLRARSQRGIAAGLLDGIWYVSAGTPDSEGGCDRSGSQEHLRWFSYLLAIILTATQLAIASHRSTAGPGRIVSDGGQKRRRRPWSRDSYLRQSESLF